MAVDKYIIKQQRRFHAYFLVLYWNTGFYINTSLQQHHILKITRHCQKSVLSPGSKLNSSLHVPSQDLLCHLNTSKCITVFPKLSWCILTKSALVWHVIPKFLQNLMLTQFSIYSVFMILVHRIYNCVFLFDLLFLT